MLSGLGGLFELGPELIDDLQTAVSEACNNVVLHAYPDGPGPLTLRIAADDAGLEVVVRDRGHGITQVAAASEDRMGLGLAVISALADVAEFQSESEGGTAVRMMFGPRQSGIRLPEGGRGSESNGNGPTAVRGDVRARVAPPTLLGGVLGRIARALAASAHFSLDRFSDLYLITDELAAHAAQAAAGAGIQFGIVASPGRLEMLIGPLRPGTVQRLIGGDGPGSFPLMRLVDELAAAEDPAGELLRVLVADRRS